uniref:3-phosphoshikimate 1-carboxyvinyltransferase n=1 Tax=uncultured Thiotrichaceae bacterium TaxID=298394 RepID=A0A6S6SMJ9_9GAMM|nr:MAG: 5-Enolpyruvylshikimate-3-phosphate synthase (EC [uncultured Thiotrichaceae bacterium]
MSYLESKAVRITPHSAPLNGKVVLPGSKSITNRALLLAGLASGESRLTGALSSDDTKFMAEALRQLGVEVTQVSGTEFLVKGKGSLQPSSEPLFLGNAGTATRFLTAAALLINGQTVVDGDEHMRKRPISGLTDTLREMGVSVVDTNGCPPVTLTGNGVFPQQNVIVDGSLSSQYISAILMASAVNDQPITISLKDPNIDARGYIDITLAVMERFGAKISEETNGVWQVEATGYQAQDYAVEPDASAATYHWVAEQLTKGSIDLGVDPNTLTQPDAKAYAVMQLFPDMPAEIDGSQMQDAIPALAVLAAFNNTPVKFTHIANLRVKECDRINALATELNKIQAGLAEEEPSGLLVNADPELAGKHLPTDIHTYADHRIAMSFALVGLLVDGINILDPGCVAKTYPEYWADLEALGVELSGV